MNAAIPYAVLLYSCVMGGAAVWSLWKTPDERQGRESFLYNYGAFFFYVILGLIGVAVLFSMYQSGALTTIATRTAIGVGLGGFLGPMGAYIFAKGATPLAVGTARSTGYLPDLATTAAVAARKSRRQIGHGRYNT